MNYKKLNKYIGWLIFLFGAFVFLSTAEWTASLWDCGEFIATSYKLEVGHPPGAPFFMLMSRVFSLFAGTTGEVAHWINRMSALCSALTLTFLFWTITMLGKKIAQRDGQKMSTAQQLVVLGSGIVGALAFGFSDSFWFSAVEAEVYAMSSLFLAIIFWAALRWDAEITMRKNGELPPTINPLRWMVLISFLIGLAIGVHLLCILVIPAIGYMIANQRYKKYTLVSFLITGVIGVAVLGFVQKGVIQKTISIASDFGVFFTNSIGLPIGGGAIIFFLLLAAILIFALIYTRRKGYKIVNTSILCLVVLYIGYGCFATLVIRSNANPPLDENNPENLVKLNAYLGREQYGSWPILYGPYFNSKEKQISEYGDRPPVYDNRYVITDVNGNVITSFKRKRDAEKYIKNSGKSYQMQEKYFITNKHIMKNQVPTYVQEVLFPRMFSRVNSSETRKYKEWSGYNPDRKVAPALIGSDGRPIPTYANNMQYLVTYQLGWMYWRYFMWNYAGRQNDIQGHGGLFHGNWASGITWVDNARLGASGENAPYFTSHNPKNAGFLFIPLILGLIGLFFQFLRAPKDALVVTMFFLLTGVAIIIYLNQKPLEPRERDYAYAGSFYAFAIWIGLGVYGLYESFRSFVKEDYQKLLVAYVGILIICVIADLSSSGTILGGAVRSALVIGGVAGAGFLLMATLKKLKFSQLGAAGICIILGLVAPVLMGTQGWQGHDRSHRSSTRALAYNYLVGCSKDAILFTNGDNDTFPLWYIQEVEGFRNDVRVANLSLMQTDWYSEQMKMRAYKSDPLPIKFREDQLLMGEGGTDYVLFLDYNIYKSRISQKTANDILKTKIKTNPNRFNLAFTHFRKGLYRASMMMKGKTNRVDVALEKIRSRLSEPIQNPGFENCKFVQKIVPFIFQNLNNGNILLDQSIVKQLQEVANNWTKSWDYLPLSYAMKFVRNDANELVRPGGRKLRFFPSSGFVIPVNSENAVRAGIISPDYKGKALKELRIDFRKGGYFSSDVRGISREDVMMLDILGNFHWKRGIYYSSPTQSSVGKALFGAGYLQKYGRTYGLTPLKEKAAEKYAREKMYNNVMHKYHFGNLNGEGILVDYYTRRQTSQYRRSFLTLARSYLPDYNKAKKQISVDSLASQAKKDSAFYSNKIDSILEYSLDVIPISKAFDFGTPRAMGSKLANGDNMYTDGVIPIYIRTLYEIGQTEDADKLAMEYLKQVETMLDYFQHSDAMIAYHNKSYFISSTMNLFRVYAQILVNSPGSTVESYAGDLDNRLTNDVVPGIVARLKHKTITETIGGGRTRERMMGEEADDFAQLYKALRMRSGLSMTQAIDNNPAPEKKVVQDTFKK